MSTTQIYLIRHGQSVGNLHKTFLGHTDLDLTELGHRQAENVAEFLKDLKVDVIYSSDLMRAYNTAVHTAEVKGMEITKSQNLREIYAGEWEGRTFEELRTVYAESFGHWVEDIGTSRCDGGESALELQKRISEEVTKIAEENQGKTVLIFTHATVIRVFKAFCDNCTPETIKDVPWAANASVSHFEYRDGRFSTVVYGNDSFQGEAVSTIPANV